MQTWSPPSDLSERVAPPARSRPVASGAWSGRKRRGSSAGQDVTAQLARLETLGYRVLRHVETARDLIDQVVVGPTGVFVVRVNTWRGRFYVRRDGWFCHSKRDPGELVWDVAREAMSVKARLQLAGVTTEVEGIVAVTDSRMAGPVIQMGRTTFVAGPEVVRYIRSRRPALSDEQVHLASVGIPA